MEAKNDISHVKTQEESQLHEAAPCSPLAHAHQLLRKEAACGHGRICMNGTVYGFVSRFIGRGGQTHCVVGGFAHGLQQAVVQGKLVEGESLEKVARTAV